PSTQISVDSEYIGGDFGGKGLAIDEFACYFLAKATGRPVKSVMSYIDELQATNSRHASVMRMRTAVDKDGRILAHEGEYLYDGGAYAGAKPLADLSVASGIRNFNAYRIPQARFVTRAVYTNALPG